jgi:hypothetical protein
MSLEEGIAIGRFGIDAARTMNTIRQTDKRTKQDADRIQLRKEEGAREERRLGIAERTENRAQQEFDVEEKQRRYSDKRYQQIMEAGQIVKPDLSDPDFDMQANNAAEAAWVGQQMNNEDVKVKQFQSFQEKLTHRYNRATAVVQEASLALGGLQPDYQGFFTKAEVGYEGIFDGNDIIIDRENNSYTIKELNGNEEKFQFKNEKEMAMDLAGKMKSYLDPETFQRMGMSAKLAKWEYNQGRKDMAVNYVNPQGKQGQIITQMFNDDTGQKEDGYFIYKGAEGLMQVTAEEWGSMGFQSLDDAAKSADVEHKRADTEFTKTKNDLYKRGVLPTNSNSVSQQKQYPVNGRMVPETEYKTLKEKADKMSEAMNFGTEDFLIDHIDAFNMIVGKTPEEHQIFKESIEASKNDPVLRRSLEEMFRAEGLEILIEHMDDLHRYVK